MSKKVKRGRGRPVEFKGFLAKQLVSVVKKHGLTKGHELIHTTDCIQKGPGQPKGTYSVSIPTLAKLATEAGVTFKRGRPLKVAA